MKNNKDRGCFPYNPSYFLFILEKKCFALLKKEKTKKLNTFSVKLRRFNVRHTFDPQKSKKAQHRL